MSKRIEAILKSYPEMVQKRNCLAYQIAHFKGLSAEEVIESMYTPRQDGERVQTSTISDKTAQIAMVYQERTLRSYSPGGILIALAAARLGNDEVTFLEAAIQALPGTQAGIMWDMIVEQMKWDAIEGKYRISHTTLYRQRQRAISELEKLYAHQDHDLAAYMLD